MRRAEIDEQNRYLIRQQYQFRMAADVVADAWMAFPEVCAVAVIGSVAKRLLKEIPRFAAFRHARASKFGMNARISIWRSGLIRNIAFAKSGGRAIARCERPMKRVPA